MVAPDKDLKFPIDHHDKFCFLKNAINNPNIIIGDYTYYADFENIDRFEKNVKYHYPSIGDQLIIGKFCMIASDVKFIMNGGNHLSEGISAYPFAIFKNGWDISMKDKSYPNKGNTIIGNDVWLGFNATIMPGIQIGDGAIIAANSHVTKNVEPYSIVGGNPAVVIRKRFSEEKIKQLLALKWWNWEIEKINQNLQHLTADDIDNLK